MKIDLHVHSAFSRRPSQWILQKISCPESFTDPLQVYRTAREKGMSMVTLCDHNTIDGALAATPLRNFWISLDSAVPAIHEEMRGFKGVVRGMEKALPIFHDRGIFPSVNLGLNRNISHETMALEREDDLHPPEETVFYRTFARGLEAFYRQAIGLGFTIANACYPMSMADDEAKTSLDAVYAAASPDRVVCFGRREKALMFKALMDTIPRFRSQIRIFSPLTSLYALNREYTRQADLPAAYPCRGGIDFFYVSCQDGNTYPCGYRGGDNLGPFQDLDIRKIKKQARCLACDWECFRDPTELAGPVLDLFRHPVSLAGKMAADPDYRKHWIKDLRYYRACDYFDGRRPPKAQALARF